jgi:large subunit ribosomal protein L13
VLGRVACKIANILRGKNKPYVHAAPDTGDFVIVINAARLKLSGNKLDDKHLSPPQRLPGRRPPPGTARPRARRTT